ncbi:MAG: hypothetical protein JXB48_05890 [Candidatus Latescibacteria bacterium]|nr:hypothetical protein [Candidatus Latescibacterota bacterium]
MKTKDFDCVKMKRKGAEVVYQNIKSMTTEEQLDYWQKGTKKLQQKKLHVSQKQNVSHNN